MAGNHQVHKDYTHSIFPLEVASGWTPTTTASPIAPSPRMRLIRLIGWLASAGNAPAPLPPASDCAPNYGREGSGREPKEVHSFAPLSLPPPEPT